jgi:RNA polymerase sigma-70 factor (ECF subfamily)
MQHHDTSQSEFLSAFDAYHDAIFRFCILKVSGREVAQDLTQETFMRYWQGVQKGEKFTNERAYLYTIARNLVIDWYRKKKDSSLDAILEAGVEFSGETGHSITDHAEAEEVLSFIRKLDEDSRDLLLMRFVEGMSPQEIARHFKQSANVISVRIHRALLKVQEAMRAVPQP